MITLFEKYGKFAHKGDIITSEINSPEQSEYVVIYVSSTIYLLFSEQYDTGIKSMYKLHLHNIIEGNLATLETVKEVFKRDPNLVTRLYMSMNKFKKRGKEKRREDKILEEKNEISDIQYMWNIKVPELKFHVEANKYNI